MSKYTTTHGRHDYKGQTNSRGKRLISKLYKGGLRPVSEKVWNKLSSVAKPDQKKELT